MQWFSNSTSQHDSSMILIDGRVKLIILVLRGAICITSPSCKCFEEAFGTITPMMNRHYDHMQRKSTCYSSMHQFICSSHGQRASCLGQLGIRGLRGLPLRLLRHTGFLSSYKDKIISSSLSKNHKVILKMLVISDKSRLLFQKYLPLFLMKEYF